MPTTDSAVVACVSFALIATFGELLAGVLFRMVLNPRFKVSGDLEAVIEGIIERLFLFLCFVNGIEIALVFFGTLKVATRISSADEDKVPKMYYLMGNLISASFAVSYFMIWAWIAPMTLT